MNVRWHFLLLPLLAVCFALSTFEVDVDGIVTNSWGDAYDAYLPTTFAADNVTQPTQYPQTGVRGHSPKGHPALVSHFYLPIRDFRTHVPVYGWGCWTYLRCCQLLI